MGIKKYKYNTDTTTFKPIRQKRLRRIRNIAAFLIVTAFFGVISGFTFSQKLNKPEENSLAAELQEMKIQYQLLNKKVKQSQKVLAQVEERDNNIYRSYFELERSEERRVGKDCRSKRA